MYVSIEQNQMALPPIMLSVKYFFKKDIDYYLVADAPEIDFPPQPQMAHSLDALAVLLGGNVILVPLDLHSALVNKWITPDEALLAMDYLSEEVKAAILLVS